MTANYYRFCHAVILVYDLDDEGSLFSLTDWIKEAKRNCRWQDKMTFAVWGNKSDLSEQSTRQEAIDAFTREYKIPDSLSFKMSAKTGENVQEAFQKVVEAVDDKFSKLDLMDVSLDARDTALLTFSIDGSPRKRKRCLCSSSS